MHKSVSVCENCNTRLTGAYCHECGQRGIEVRRPVLGLAQDIIVETLSIDSKLLRTVFGLIVNPGALARNYIAGQRARHSPPFRVYLFFSLVFFALFFFTLNREGVFSGPEDTDEVEQTEITEGNDPEDLPDTPLTGAGNDISGDVTADEAADEIGNTTDEPVEPGENAPVDDGDSSDDELLNVTINGENITADSDLNYNGPAFLEPYVRRMVSNIKAVRDDPRLFQANLKDTIPRVLLLLPIIYVLLLLVFYFYKKGVFVYDLLIISLYMHGALYLYFSLMLLVQVTPIANVPVLNLSDEILSIWAIIQPFRALSINFESKWYSVLLKGAVINTAYWILAIILIVTGMAISLSY